LYSTKLSRKYDFHFNKTWFVDLDHNRNTPLKYLRLDQYTALTPPTLPPNKALISINPFVLGALQNYELDTQVSY
jgi:hypothetical protein